ncbi:MAG: LysR family transcriptional regulator [Ramlibacter sp.]|nr:LysR family transcriptional regulator [Ramlibacter sp.]
MPRAPLAPVSFNSALSHSSADKRIHILRAVGASGSISQAARDAGVSYKAAWQAIDTLTNLAGAPLVERAVGGAGGGGARLTEQGRQLLAAADQIAQARHQVLGRLRRDGPAATQAPLSHLAIRTSMRNQMPCSVSAVEGRGAVVRVHLRLDDATALVARVTRESVQLLGLVPGVAVLVLCKATAVTVTAVGASVGASRPGTNRLAGLATRVSRSAEGDEVSATLDAGVALVGFAAARSGLRARSRVWLDVDEAALVLALPD